VFNLVGVEEDALQLKNRVYEQRADGLGLTFWIGRMLAFPGRLRNVY
jgi:hypothetical protein